MLSLSAEPCVQSHRVSERSRIPFSLARIIAIAGLFGFVSWANAQDYYHKEGIELEVNRISADDAYLTFTKREGSLPAERLVIALPVTGGKEEAGTGAGVTPALKIIFHPGEAEVQANGTLDNGGAAEAINGTYQLITAEDLATEQKARSEKLDAELNRVYGEVRGKLPPNRAAELKDLQREWIHSVYTPDIDAGSREPVDGEHWRQLGDQAADRIKFLRDFATGKAASGPPSLQIQLKAAEEAEAWPSVAEIARHMLVNTPKDAGLWEKRARAFATAEDWTRCAETLDDWLKATGQKIPAMDSLRGDVALAQGHKAAAVEAWNTCIRAAPKDAETRDKLADLLQRLNAWADAAKVLEQRIKIQPTPDSLSSLAVTYAVLQNWKLASANISKANKLDATDDSVAKNLPRIERAERSQIEIKKLEGAIAAAPKDVAPLLEHAIFFFDLGWPEIALKESEDALQLWKESRGAMLLRAAALVTLQRNDEIDNSDIDVTEEGYKKPAVLRALARVDSELQANGPQAALLGKRAHHLNIAGQYDLSIKDTDDALKLDANCDAALAARAEEMVSTGKDWQALPEAKRATEINPKNALAWFLIGQIENKHHNFAQATQALSKTLELQPGDRDAIALREKSYRELGKTAEADADAALLKQKQSK